MQKMTLIIIAILMTTAVQAQTVTGKQNVEKLCGCFDVEFKYAETFSPDKSYKFHDRERISGGTELSLPIEVTDKKIVIQHLLVISDSMIIKHWRDEWTYENPTVWNFKGDNVWVKQQLSPAKVKGSWTQTVWEVSDAPRYQGVSTWINTNGKTFWQNTADAPLPRREYSQRSDYNVLRRQNTIILNDSGYIHDQDNQKVIRVNGVDKLLAEEKGINSYKRAADSKCAAAKAFWDKNKVYWTKVRKAWDDYFASHASVVLKADLDGRPLYTYMDEQATAFSTGKIAVADIDKNIKTLLDKFIGEKKDLAQVK